jgi:hypothetical protein
MRIRLTFASENDLMQRCAMALRIGVMFLPSARLPEPGTSCDVDWNVRGEGLVLRATGLVAGASAVEDEGLLRQGIWIRLVDVPFVGPGLDTWLEAIGAAIQPSDRLEVPERSARREAARPSRDLPPLPPPVRRPEEAPRPRPPAPTPAPQLPEPAREEDLGWLSGNIRPD